jgi:hypothetical protein
VEAVYAIAMPVGGRCGSVWERVETSKGPYEDIRPLSTPTASTPHSATTPTNEPRSLVTRSTRANERWRLGREVAGVLAEPYGLRDLALGLRADDAPQCGKQPLLCISAHGHGLPKGYARLGRSPTRRSPVTSRRP